MVRINLLPWREERRKQRQKAFVTMLGASALGAALASLLIVMYFNGLVSGQQERNGYLRDQITEVDKQIKEIDELDRQRARLLARKEVIEELQANRSQMVHLFDSLVRTIPEGVVLTSIKQDNQRLTLEGRSQSNARVSTYMRNLESSGWMTRPDLSIIEARSGEAGLPYVFNLVVTLANPNGEGAEAPVDGMPAADAGDAADSAAENADAVDGAPATPAVEAAAPAAPAATVQPPAEPPSEPAAEQDGHGDDAAVPQTGAQA
ncbi:MAG: PilN domain-containing protein [Pseudoxanthomonas suwonensis]|nr:PilN domain-containing protein [Pseudoxanthomonas suwonensis]